MSETAVASTATRTRSARTAGAAVALRTATHSAHRAVESLPLMRALMSADIDPSTYTDVLRRQWRVHAGWEQANADWLRAQAWAYRPRTPALRADLDWLQAGAPDGAPMPAPRVVDDASGWGMLYVVEGSALGGQVIARHLRRTRPELAGALRHFGAATPPGQEWPRFQALLERHLRDTTALARAIDGARALFAHFHHHLAGARA